MSAMKIHVQFLNRTLKTPRSPLVKSINIQDKEQPFSSKKSKQYTSSSKNLIKSINFSIRIGCQEGYFRLGKEY